MLTRLDLRHADALEVFLAGFDGREDELHGYFCDRHAPIEQAVAELAAWASGDGLPDGWVPCTTLFWELDGALTGVINIRHHLTPQLEQIGGHIGYSVGPAHRGRGIATAMLGGALNECRRLGIDRALLTADASNVASCRTIEHHRGILEKEESHEGELQRWYWIDLGAE